MLHRLHLKACLRKTGRYRGRNDERRGGMSAHVASTTSCWLRISIQIMLLNATSRCGRKSQGARQSPGFVRYGAGRMRRLPRHLARRSCPTLNGTSYGRIAPTTYLTCTVVFLTSISHPGSGLERGRGVSSALWHLRCRSVSKRKASIWL
jgi:hypothetical protein